MPTQKPTSPAALPLALEQIVEIRCDDVDDNGYGVAALREATVRAPNLLPGENAKVRIVHKSKHGPHYWAQVVEHTTRSPERAQPRCRAWGECGGCVLQHWSSQAQLAWKQEQVRRAFAAYSSLSEVDVVRPVASPREYHYRNRAKFIYTVIDGEAVLGAFAPRTHQVVSMAGCALLEAGLEEAREGIRSALGRLAIVPYDEISRQGFLRYVVLRQNRAGQILAIFVTTTPDWERCDELVAALCAALPTLVGIVQNINASHGNALLGHENRLLWGTALLEEKIGAAMLLLSATSFTQVNRGIAEKIYHEVVRLAAPSPDDIVVDCHSGTGAIALHFVGQAKQIIAIESNPDAVSDLNRTRQKLSDESIITLAGQAGDQMHAVAQANILIFNPPRAGIESALIASVQRLQPDKIVYLSCSAKSLARDVNQLLGLGYTVSSVLTYDMHVHTPHVECLTLLTRANRSSAAAAASVP